MISARIFQKSREKQESGRTVSWPASVARSLQLPEDCQRGRPLVSATGRERIRIENFKGICSYTPEAVSLKTADGRLTVNGKCLMIDCYTKDEMEISGKIRTVEFE